MQQVWTGRSDRKRPKMSSQIKRVPQIWEHGSFCCLLQNGPESKTKTSASLRQIQDADAEGPKYLFKLELNNRGSKAKIEVAKVKIELIIDSGASCKTGKTPNTNH